LEALINRIKKRMTVRQSVTMIALSAVKEDAPINVFPVAPKSDPQA
jgi:hypothetical protein